jgi:hypothetical protein
MKLKPDLSKIPKIPVVIGGIFALTLVVVIVTTVALKKNLLHEESIQLEGLKPAKSAMNEPIWSGELRCTPE